MDKPWMAQLVAVSCLSLAAKVEETQVPLLLDLQAPDNDIGKNSFNYFQVRSAFSMAFSTLTNVKTIMALGPNRSILGTIIRPDAVLLERKGGCNGEVTFNNLLPGAGEPLQQEHNDQQGFYCNWQLDNEEEPLSQGKSIGEDGSAQSSGMKRKVSKVKKLVKKRKDNGDVGVFRHEESASRNEKDVKKKRWRRSRHGCDKNDFGHHRGGGGSQLSRTC